jgi:hypothetical protein
MTDLREEIGLPKIGGEIVAGFLPNRSLENNLTPGEFYWEVVFVLAGPDARYKAGISFLNPKRVQELIQELVSASQKMRKLDGVSFTGTFSERLSKNGTPIVEVKAENGNIWVEFSVCSETNRFIQKLSHTDVDIILDKMKTVEQQGERMIETLRAII